MGADLVAFCAVMPTGKTKALVAAEHRRISKAFAALDLPTLKGKTNEVEQDVGGDGMTGWDALIDATGVNANEYENDLGERDFDGLVTRLAEDLDTVKGFDENYDARDLGGASYVVGGVKVTFLHAGEMSWGDRPEGAGYEALGALWRLGIADKLYAAVKGASAK